LHTPLVVFYGGQVAGRVEWVLLAYRLPREPSTPRITLWRKLRRLGAVQVVDGLTALPADARTREQLEWLAEEIGEAGGQATVWLGRLGSAAQERALAARMAAAVAAEYQQVIHAAAAAGSETDGTRRRTLGRLRRQLHRIGQRDFFPPPDREQARAAVDTLAACLDAASAPATAGTPAAAATGPARRRR
jgi:uncharacterized protein YdbL (DUF1318 family)